MRHFSYQQIHLLTGGLVLSSLLMTGCMDNSYDLSSIDGTIGIGNDSIFLPSNSSTQDIRLGDILDLEGNDCIVTLANGDYVFQQRGDNVKASHPRIEPLSIDKNEQSSRDFMITLPDIIRKNGKKKIAIPAQYASQTIQLFSYDGTHNDDVVSLSSATVNSHVKLEIYASDALKSFIPSFDEIVMNLPDYLKFKITKSNVIYNFDDASNKLIFKKVNTSDRLVVEADVVGLRNFSTQPSSANNYLIFDEKTIRMRGSIDISVTYSNINPSTADVKACYIRSDMWMSNFVITGATGKFAPEFKMQNVGDIYINNIPEFLTDKNVKVDLYNPQLVLTVNSDVNIPGIVDGTILSMDREGKVIGKVDIQGIRIKPNSITKVSISRRADGIDAMAYDQMLTVPSLSDLICKIPHHLTFSTTARGDGTVQGDIVMGHDYSIQPAFSFNAPLAFAEKAEIIHRDSVSGWHDDLQDFYLSDDACILLTADVLNTIPAFVGLQAYAIDLNGDSIGSDRIEVQVDGVIDGSPDGVKTTESKIRVKLIQKDKEAFKQLDGIVYKLDCTSKRNDKSIEGIVLNKDKQSLTFKNIKAKIIGKIITDLNN